MIVEAATTSAKTYVSPAFSVNGGASVCALKLIVLPLTLPGPRNRFQPEDALFTWSSAMYASTAGGVDASINENAGVCVIDTELSTETTR